MAEKLKIEPTYSLKNIKIKNFKGIKNISLENLPRDASWVFLTGENGFGKTSVLQAISMSLYRDQMEENKIWLNPPEFNFNLSGDLNKKDPFDFYSAYEILEQSRIYIGGFPYLACYGSSRLDTYSESSTTDVLKDATENLFNTQTLLHNIELQLSRWYFKQDDPEFKAKYDFVRDLLISLLSVKDIKIDKKTDAVLYVEKDIEGNSYQPLESRDLAAGYRSIIAMVGDMILRLFELQPEITNPADLVGIIIIDELDLHLHPKWQKRLPGLLSKCFPRIQFIASTHSPIPLLGAPEGSVFLTVNRSEEEGITVERLIHLEKELASLTPNLLLNSQVFGYAELFSSQFNSDQNIKTEETQGEVLFNQQVKKRLEEDLSPENREAIRKLLKKG